MGLRESTEQCEDCKERIECLAEEETCSAVKLVMEMVLGDYIGVFEDSASSDDIRKFQKGCIIICNHFDLDIAELDVDGML